MNGIRKRPFDVLGRFLSCAFFAAGLLAFRWPPALVLFGFWLEEAAAFALIGPKSAIVERRTGRKEDGNRPALAIMLLFPAVHLVFIGFFVLFDSWRADAASVGGFFALLRGAPAWMSRPGFLPVLELSAGVLAWSLADLLRIAFAGKGARLPSQEELLEGVKASLLLPHITIIVGGFALILLRLGSWMAVSLIAGKCLVELLLLPANRRKADAIEAEKAADAFSPPSGT